MSYKFLLSDESVNAYGTRVLSSGILLEDYKKNPIVLWGHNRSYRDSEDTILPIGKISKIWIEKAQLFGEVEFDQEDEFAQKIESKVKQKILNACSISISVMATSEEAQYIKYGQSRPTIIESSLREVSIVDIPANKNCVRLFDSGDGLELNFSDGNDNFLLPLINQNNDDMNFKEDVNGALGLKDANEQAVLAEIQRLKDAESKNEGLEKKLAEYRDREKLLRTAEVAELVDGAIEARKILAKDRENYVALCEKDFDATKGILESMGSVAELSHGDKAAQTSSWDLRMSEIRKESKQLNK